MNNLSNNNSTAIKDRGQIDAIYAGFGVLIASLISVKIEFLICGSLFAIISALIIYNWKQTSNTRVKEIKRLLFIVPLIIIAQIGIILFKLKSPSPYLNICAIGNFLNDAIVLFSLLKTKKYLEENTNDSTI
ncbi:MAG: hypothetical protein K9L17_03445 [Clostridiales bacterium]|nr:hypothetical protein [Clostridiales bacterium]MCF8021734.1 hypothetical protein [Clostridiales bacterium]